MSNGRESLILQLLNNPIDKSLLRKIKNDYNDIPNCYKKSSLDERIAHFNKLKKELHKIFIPSIGIENRVNEMQDFVNEYSRPIVKVNDTLNFEVVPFDEDENISDTESFIEKIVVEAFYDLADHIGVYNIVSCAHCNKYFVATRKDARFCSITCKHRADFLKRKKLYYRIILSRRKDGKYLPINNIRCKKCRTSIPLPKYSSGKIIKSVEFIKCSACKAANRNPWAFQK